MLKKLGYRQQLRRWDEVSDQYLVRQRLIRLTVMRCSKISFHIVT